MELAATLYPGQSILYATGIEAIQAYPGKSHVIQDRLQSIFDTALSFPPNDTDQMIAQD